MNTLKKYCEQFFLFLNEKGYVIASNSEHEVKFRKNSTEIELSFNVISYELSCQFVENGDRMFTLQDILTYGKFNDLKGTYQLGDKTQLIQGVEYLANVIKIVLKKYDISNAEFFNNLYKYRLETRERLLNEYYFETDMKKAEQFWKDKKYNEAKQIYEKHKKDLSKMQNERLKYLNNNVT